MNKNKSFKQLQTIAAIIAILWLLLFLSALFPLILNWGIKPRTVSGLIGIVTAPFLHGNATHLIANSLALFVFGLIFLKVEKTRTVYILVPIYLLSGFGTWAIGRAGAVHIGASGIIYGLFGYLVSIGIFRKNFTLILLSILLLFFYGSLLWGIIPIFNNPLISWEGHLCGFVSGIITARAQASLERKKS